MTTEQQPPQEPGIYPVTILAGDGEQERTFAKWDGSCWRLWCERWDPPEWDVAAYLNCRVIEWRMP